MSSHRFDKEYFENGVRTGRSLYKDYRWLPEVSFPVANTVKKILPTPILDYGCAKGFTIYALRLLGAEVYGYDISKYALTSCKKEVAKYLYFNREKVPPVVSILAKDVLEHVSKKDLKHELLWIRKHCKYFFAIVPLGEKSEYRIQEYGFDSTHLIKEDEEWWAKKFIEAGFKINEFYHTMPGIKEHWYKHNKIGNGFFINENFTDYTT